MSEEQRTILITGASGVVGRAVAAQARGHLIGLVHSNREAPEVDELIVCDMTAPRLGLDWPQWERLTQRVDGIVHSAALTEWGRPREHYQRVNVEGTRRVIELAQAARAPVHYISTIFVLALLQGEPLREDNVVRNYIFSKLESERLLDDCGVPHTIFRPTNLIGDSHTGASTRPQIVQALSDFICRGRAPYYPSHPGNLVDVVPLDALSIPVARVAECGRTGGVHHVSYGAQAMDVDTALEVLRTHARERGRDIGRAQVVDPRLPLPVPLGQLSATSRPFLRVGIDVSEVTHACGGVLPSSLAELKERFEAPDIQPAEAYRRSLDYWARQRTSAPLAGQAR